MSLVRIQKKQEAPVTGKVLGFWASTSTTNSSIYVPKSGTVYVGVYLNRYWPSNPIDVFASHYFTSFENCPASEVPLATFYYGIYNISSNLRWFKAIASGPHSAFFKGEYAAYAFVCIS